jgi:DNA-binding CsgD family transcriptional regulator
MQRLSEPDYQTLMACICQLHTFRNLESLRAWLLNEALPRLVPSDWLSYNEVDLSEPEKTLSILKPESDVFPQLFPRFCEVIHQHPLITRQMQLTTFPVHKISDFITQEDFHRTDLYQDVYRLMKVEYQIAATIRTEPKKIMAIALCREQSDYTERDRLVLEMLRPHLVVAFNNLLLTRSTEIKLDYAHLALDELSAATILVSARGQILYHTGDGLEWIDAKNPELLPQKILDWLLRQNPENGELTILDLVTKGGKMHLRAVPTATRERVLLVITRVKETSDAANLFDKFGFSPREREVVSWVCRGKTSAEIATILGISSRTVDKHMEHILEKTGAESRISLVAFLNAR